MKIFNKIEAKINQLLIKMGEKLKEFFLAKIPPSIQQSYLSKKEKISQYIESKKEQSKLKLLAFKDNWLSKEKLLGAFGQKIQKIKALVGKVTEKLSQLNGPKEFKKLIDGIREEIRSLAQSLAKVPPEKITLVVLSVAFVGLSAIGLLSTGQRIYHKTSGGAEREIASLPTGSPITRPRYHKAETRQLDLQNMKVPIYVRQGNNTIQFLNIEFSLQVTNRSTLNYIRKNEFLIRDHLLTALEPIQAEFSMEDEGKRVIKDSLLREINLFLQKRNVQGRIEKIEIIDILGG